MKRSRRHGKKYVAIFNTTLVFVSLNIAAIVQADELDTSNQIKIDEVRNSNAITDVADEEMSSITNDNDEVINDSGELISEEELKNIDIFKFQVPIANYATAEQMIMLRSPLNKEFINKIASASQVIASKNDLYASVMIAQAILESGWGNSGLASSPNFNLFGIKGNFNGQSVEMKTFEDDGFGNYYETKAYFKKYTSYYQSLEDYAEVIKGGPSWNPNYYSGAWKSNTGSYQDATSYLQGRYATDTSYASKLNSVILANDLTQYDSGGGSVTPSLNPGGEIEDGNGNDWETGTEMTYTVKSGDSLWVIARKYGVSVANLKSWNNLKSDMIFVGQELIVNEKTVSPPDISPEPDLGDVEKESIRINNFTVGDRNITGTYLGNVAKLRLYIDGNSVAWGGTLKNGSFTFYAKNQKINTETVVTMNAYGINNQLLQENVPVLVNNRGTISPNEYTLGDAEITGTYTGDVQKARVTINGKPQAWGGEFIDGRFSYYIGIDKVGRGDTVRITAYDKYDNVLDQDKLVDVNEYARGDIFPSEYRIGDATINGTYTGEIVRARVFIDNDPQAWGGTFKDDGTFSYYIRKGKITRKQFVTIFAYSEDNSIVSENIVRVRP